MVTTVPSMTAPANVEAGPKRCREPSGHRTPEHDSESRRREQQCHRPLVCQSVPELLIRRDVTDERDELEHALVRTGSRGRRRGA